MDVTHDAAHSRFVIAADGKEAELVYKRVDDHVLDLQHTSVPPALEHHGMGDALARAAFDYARANDTRVILTCPFLRRWIVSHPDERDLVVKPTDDAHR
jgi:predicted GNAT family acetyltransferase